MTTRLYALLLAVMFAAVMVFTFALTGCGLKAGVQETDGGDLHSETGTVKVTTSAPVVAASADVKADVAVVRADKQTQVTVNGNQNNVSIWKELATCFGIYAAYSLAKDWLFSRARRRHER